MGAVFFFVVMLLCSWLLWKVCIFYNDEGLLLSKPFQRLRFVPWSEIGSIQKRNTSAQLYNVVDRNKHRIGWFPLTKKTQSFLDLAQEHGVSVHTSVMKCPVVKWQKGQSYRPILVQYADTTKSIVSKAYGRSPEEQIPAGSHSVIRGLVTNRLMVTPGALQSKAADSKYRCYRHVTDS